MRYFLVNYIVFIGGKARLSWFTTHSPKFPHPDEINALIANRSEAAGGIASMTGICEITEEDWKALN